MPLMISRYFSVVERRLARPVWKLKLRGAGLKLVGDKSVPEVIDLGIFDIGLLKKRSREVRMLRIKNGLPVW